MPANERGSVQVLQKAVSILDELAAEDELTAAELAERVAEPRSSVYRLVASLRELGLVRSGGRGRFRLGLHLLELGTAVSARFDERRAALPAMQALGARTNETIFLCVRRDDEAVCIERIDGQHVRSMELRLGGAQPLHAGGAARALLAWQPQRFWDEYAARQGLTRFTPNTIASKRELRRNLLEARQNGYVVSDGDVTLGIAAIGSPIFNHDGAIAASISISGTRPMILEGAFEKRRRSVMAAAQEISLELGWRPRDSRRWWPGCVAEPD